MEEHILAFGYYLTDKREKNHLHSAANKIDTRTD